MNLSILNTAAQDFILKNLDKPIHKTVLKGSPFVDISVQELATQINSKKKCKSKLPSWYTNTIYYPKTLNIEQSSSETTAEYKSTLVSGNSLIDLTGGFGVDSFYFSKRFEHIDYCELNEELAKIVTCNYKALSCKNIKPHIGDGLSYLKTQTKKYDVIYLDPSRRNDSKGKVFLLEDCLPNVPQYLDFLLNKSDTILVKTSPLLDITGALRVLKFVAEVHVVAVNNEVKELLFLIKKNWKAAVEISAINMLNSTSQKFTFKFKEAHNASFSEPKKHLYEPNAALLKAGAFDQLSSHLKLAKLHQNSHLYTANELVEFPGRTFIIDQVIGYHKKEIRKLIPDKKANITTRNFKASVQHIRAKIGIRDGGNLYLFFTTDIHNKQIVIFCRKV